jgi:Protein of unknown function (DUF1566)
MAASRRALVAAAAFAVTLAACDALLGLNSYQNVPCLPDDCPEAGPEASPLDAADGAYEGGTVTDSQPGPDVLEATLPPPEGGYPVPFAHEIWVHWRMPNPDAAIAPDFPDAGTLPNQMAYDTGADGGAATAYDLVTSGPDGGGLTWWRASLPATSLEDTDGGAWEECYSLGPGWRVPTRIELISLVDFTQPSGPTIDPAAFPDTKLASYWTSSPVPAETGTVSTWTVSFQTGLASYFNQATYVRCVTGGAPN